MEKNKRAKSLLFKALDHMNKDRIVAKTNECRQYQSKVRERLRKQKQDEERISDHTVQYVASMLPTAMEMHRFIKFMRKDKVFESNNGFKIVSQIRTHKDQERLEYLLNNKLSAK